MVRHSDGRYQLQPDITGHTPVAWVKDYAAAGAIRLPTEATEYASLEELADQVRTFIHGYFDCDGAFESVAVLYVMHTWLYERFHSVPYIRFLGEPETGKTRGTEVIGALCYRSVSFAGSVTPAPMYRMIEDVGGTR